MACSNNWYQIKLFLLEGRFLYQLLVIPIKSTVGIEASSLLQNSLTTRRKILLSTPMDKQTNEVPLFDGTNYSQWRERMKRYLKSKGSGVWDIITTSKN